jgi:hypothetical protein
MGATWLSWARGAVLCGVAAAAGILSALGLGLYVLVALALTLIILAAFLVAIRAPAVWLSSYVIAMMVSPDPHIVLGSVTIAFHFGDLLFAGAVPAMIRGGQMVRTPWPVVAVLVWPLATLPSAFALSGTSTGFTSMFKWVRLIESLFPLIFAMSTIRNAAGSLEILVRSFTIGALVGAAYGIAQFFLGFNLSFLGIQYGYHYVYFESGARLRAVGIFNEASGYGTMNAMLLFFALIQLLFIKAWPKWYAFALYLALPVSVLGLLLSFARAPAIALIGSLMIFVLVAGWQGVVRITFAAAGIVGLLGAALIALPSIASLAFSFRILPFLSTGLTTSGLSAIDSGRLVNWATIMSEFLALPPPYMIFGVGYKSLLMSNLEVNADFGMPVAGDNQFLTTLVEQGPVGLLFLVMFIVYLTWCFWLPIRRKRAHNNVHVYGGIFFAFWLAQLLFQLPFVDYFTYFRLIPVLAAAAGMFALEFGGRASKRNGPAFAASEPKLIARERSAGW